jgi:hypothetical protein
LVALGNGGFGFYIDQGSSNNSIGAIGNPNLIRYNQGQGIYLSGNQTLGNTISGNSFLGNSGLAIDIEPSGINPNDPGDVDDGAARKLNTPVIEKIQSLNTGMELSICGVLNTGHPEFSTIELYTTPQGDPNTDCEGYQLIGLTHPTADGRWILNVPHDGSAASICALAADSSGNTSEFSPCYNTWQSTHDIFAHPSYRLFPNPVREQATLEVRMKKAGTLDLKIIDAINGNSYQSIKQVMDEGMQIVTLDFSIKNHLPSGFFILMIEYGGEKIRIPFVHLK